MRLKKGSGPHTQPQLTNTHNLTQHEQHNQKTTTTSIDSFNPNSHNNHQITTNDAHPYYLLLTLLSPTNIPSLHQKRESLRVADPIIILQDQRFNNGTTTRPREKHLGWWDNLRLEKDLQALNLLLSRHRREGNSKIQLLESRTGRHRKE